MFATSGGLVALGVITLLNGVLHGGLAALRLATRRAMRRTGWRPEDAYNAVPLHREKRDRH